MECLRIRRRRVREHRSCEAPGAGNYSYLAEAYHELSAHLCGEVRWASRTTSLVLSTTDALKSVGFCHKGKLPFSNNLDLRVGSAHMQLIDWNYEAIPSSSSAGSLLSDPTPLRYDFTA